MNKIIVIVLLSACLKSCGQSGAPFDASLFKKFEDKALPIALETEMYDVYTLFEGKKDWRVSVEDLGIERRGCRKRYGYKIAETSNYTALIYPLECGETIIYYLSTFNVNGELISTQEVMGLYGDNDSLNGYISDSLEIKLVYRSLLPNKENKADVEVSEKIEQYSVSDKGSISLVSSSSEETKYYNLDNKGRYIPVSGNK